MSRLASTLAWTADDFVQWERQQIDRHEWNGQAVIAMTGATLRHARVIRNVRNALERQCPSGCEIFTEGFMLQAGKAVRYPDVLMLCGVDLGLDEVLTHDATVAVEVLSPSSVATDTGAKVNEYAQVPSLSVYLVIDPARQGCHCLSAQRSRAGTGHRRRRQDDSPTRRLNADPI